jgi:chromosome partitioning protein
MSTILSIMSNAGGVGKTTLGVHIAQEMSLKSFSVILMDLDPQRSIDVFCGLKPVEPSNSITKVLAKDFKGEYPLIPCWGNPKIEVCQSHPTLAEIANDLVIRKRGEYTLADRLKRFPLPHDLVILDCPATLGMLNVNALAASTQILIPVQLEMKSITGCAELVEWIISTSDELQLDPRPPILGIVPSMYDKRIAGQRQYLQQLPEVGDSLDIKVYSPIRDSSEFPNSSSFGLSLHKYRPAHPACLDFKAIADDLSTLIQGSSKGG